MTRSTKRSQFRQASKNVTARFHVRGKTMSQCSGKQQGIHRLLNPNEVFDPHKQAHIFWEGTQFATTSFALVNRELCRSIIDTGLAELTIVPYEPDQFPANGNPKLEKLLNHDIRTKGFSLRDREKRPHVWVRHQWPPRPNPPGKARWIIMFPWECSVIPRYYTDMFNLAEEIWTPSNFSRNAFVSSGVDPSKVHVVPHGADPGLFSPVGESLALGTAKRFKFLFVGATIYRKGIDVLLESYSRAFTPRDDVCLVIKDLGVNTLYKGQTAQDLIRKYQGQKGVPEILYLAEEFDEEQMAGLYRACDVFVSAYRGEGFSLPALEAMSSGLPVIVTGGGATDDFVDEEVGWLINAERRAVGKKVYGQKLDKEAFLLEPDKQHLEEIMRVAYSSPSEIFRKGVQGALRVRRHWTWKHSALHVLLRIDALCGTAMRAEAEKGSGDADGDTVLIKKALEQKHEKYG
jgi:glycosyltransferase involved in cell wall biosynthesis